MRLARPFFRALVPVALAGVAGSVPAVEPYVATGFPWMLAGVAQPLGERFTLRADFGSIAHHAYSGSTSDNDYRGNVRYQRLALLGDWFALGNPFHLTAGVTFNHARASLRASPHGGQIVLNGVTYSAPSDLYYVESELSLPNTTPYLGLGWGHHGGGRGFSFDIDAGATIGKAKATALQPSSVLAAEIAATPTGANDLASENGKFQDDVGRFKAVPQLAIGVGYRF